MPAGYREKLWELKRLEFEKKKSLWDFGFECVLVIGLALEIFGFAKQISKDVALNGRIEELRSNNLVLAIKLEPRADRLRQSAFKNLVKGKASGEIEIVYAPYNGEAAGFAAELYRELSQAGWKMAGFKPKPADLEPTWASPRPLVPESFASIAIVSHDPNDELLPRWQMVPLDTKTVGVNGTNDILVVHHDKLGRVDRYQLRLPPAGAGAGVLAIALERSGFHSERNINSNLPPGRILVVIGAKE